MKHQIRPTLQSTRLANALKAAGVPLSRASQFYIIQRTYGCRQRASGEWSLELALVDSRCDRMECTVGSQWPVGELLKRGFTVRKDEWGLGYAGLKKRTNRSQSVIAKTNLGTAFCVLRRMFRGSARQTAHTDPR